MRRRIALLGVWGAAAIVASAGCGVDERVAPAPSSSEASFGGTLSVDVRGAADVVIEDAGGDATTVRLTLRDIAVSDLFPMPLVLEGAGRREPFPESGSALYTAKLTLAPSGAGACGQEPISVALALHRRGGDDHVGGSLTAYCGSHFYGVPARIFRLAGDLPPR